MATGRLLRERVRACRLQLRFCLRMTVAALAFGQIFFACATAGLFS
jgi:hypothetical protein